ncbi:MAG: putative regulatory protein FmdB family [Phycisphaerales bacterium]|jgi:putative FmdB family regulatory protein|nr:putative regulatory protein FmdB family [Phycisphaerales bacterium]
MPTYEYKCKSCGHKFEKFHSMSAAPIKKCPDCGKNAVERLIGTGAGLIFKGSGFYITDYRDAAYKNSAKADSGETATKSESGDKAAGAKTESTPASTASDSKTTTESKSAKSESKPAKGESKSAEKHKK